MNYIILDVETADTNSTICQLAMVKVEDGIVVNTYNQLIKPEPFYFNPINIEVHHILPSDVENCHTLDYYLDDIMRFIGDDIVICHNSAFDMKALQSHLNDYSINFACSYLLSRKYIDSPKYGLQYLANQLIGYEYQAHDALADCLATNELVKYLLHQTQYSLEELLNPFQIGKVNYHQYSGFKRLSSGYDNIIVVNSNHALNGKMFAITGKLNKSRKTYIKLLASVGAYVTNDLDAKTSFLITSNKEMISHKLRMAEKYQVPIINEVELLEMIGVEK